MHSHQLALGPWLDCATDIKPLLVLPDCMFIYNNKVLENQHVKLKHMHADMCLKCTDKCTVVMSHDVV